MDDLKKIKEKHQNKLLKKQNVCGAAVGQKWKDGKPTKEPAILVFIQKRIPEGAITKMSEEDMVPDKIDGVRTEIIEVGNLVKHAGFRGRVRPVRPGYSFGHQNVTAGTLGGFFVDKDGDIVALTNNHVASDENAAKIGDIIYQPAASDSNKALKFAGWRGNISQLPYIGTLKKFVKLKKNNNIQDSAIVKIHPSLVNSNLLIPNYPVVNRPLNGIGEAQVGMQVQKCGRTTGYTTGRILGLHATFSIGYDFGLAQFNDCIVMSPMSKGGDSGSLVLDMDMNAVGLLFAGSKKVTIANPIAPVVNHYGLTPWSGGDFKNPSPPPANGKNISMKDWQKFTTDGSIKMIDNSRKAEITDNANHYCFLQTNLGKFTSVSCKVNTGTDASASWGPGLAIQWPTGIMKVNIRNKTFGGYFNTNYRIDIGSVKPNTDYVVRIKKTKTSYVGEVLDNGTWHTVIEIPKSIFPMDPTFVRVGKTDVMGAAKNYRASGPGAGDVVKCTIANVKIS